MKQVALLVLATAIVASVQSMDLARPLGHPPSEHHEPQIIVDTYPAEHIRHTQSQAHQGDGPTTFDREPEPHTESAEHSRFARSPKEPTRGRIVVEGSARKGSSTGGKTEGNIYVGGQIRFRRSAEEEQQPSWNVVAEQQSGAVEEDAAERTVYSALPRKPLNARIIAAETESVDEEISEGDAPAGSETRFRRSPEPRRRHRTNVDISVDKKIYEGKHGSISFGGGASKRPGERWDPHVGVSGSIRF